MRKGIGSGLGTAALGCLALMAVGSSAQAAPMQVPDVIVYDVGVDGGNSNNIEYYGTNAGIAAYSFATQSCNAGSYPLDWYDGSGNTNHPVIAQNLFRLKNGRFEQIGQSWLKHGFCAVNETEGGCGVCQSTNCDTLGIGCADTYWALLNDGRNGGSKRWVNATDGSHIDGTPGPSGNNTTRGRLQVHVEDIDPAQNVGAEYFIEGQYVAADDALANASRNNASWRRVVVHAINNIDGGGPTMREEPAIYAWQAMDPSVVIRPIFNDEVPVRTTYFLAYKVTQRANGTFHYEYALQNLNSDQSAGSLSLTIDPAANITNIGFHDVDYHSGDPYSGTDWGGAKIGGEMRWATEDFNTNADANALRWGTLYNYRFDSNYGPGDGQATIGLFKPGTNSMMTVDNVPVPLVVGSGSKAMQEPVPPLSGGTIELPLTVPRNGARVNPDALTEVTQATVGGEWLASIDMDGATRSMLMVSFRGPAEGTMTDMGELLIQGPFTTYSGDGEHSLLIPDDSALEGATFSVQAARLTRDGWQLTNALDVRVGAASPSSN